MIRYLTAGESHNKFLVSIIEGLPSGLEIDEEFINNELLRRQKGFGRSQRMRIESDRAVILSGVRKGRTTGSPIAMQIENKGKLNIDDKVTLPRPGHADLAGAIKFNTNDIRDIIERSSARETASRVAAGAICKKLLLEFKINIYSYVTNIGGAKLKREPVINSIIKNYASIEESVLRCPDRAIEKKMIDKIEKAGKAGDSVGGIFEVAVCNLPVGLGSFTCWDKRLDAKLGMSILSVPAIKGIEFGSGFSMAELPGSCVHDEIFYDKKRRKFFHKTNNAGGIEGGMSNGEPILLRAIMKPIPTLKKPLKTVDIATKKPALAFFERSDVCAVPSASVVTEAVVAIEIANVFTEKFGGDSISEMKSHFNVKY